VSGAGSIARSLIFVASTAFFFFCVALQYCMRRKGRGQAGEVLHALETKRR
jgi:preprotein translocase subunit SecG